MSDGFELEVLEVRQEAPAVRSLVLARADRTNLPGFAAGAHVKVWPPSPDGEARHYSLINTDPSADATRAPTRYRIAVRLDEAGRGGSRAMHALRAGDRLRVSEPIDGFRLDPGPGPALLLAGGIGVTPLLSMAAALKAAGRPFRAAYCGRSREQLAFRDDFAALAGDELLLHCDDEAGRVFDVAGALSDLAPGAAIYVCGPPPMIDAVVAAAAQRGIRPDRVRFELFSAPVPRAGDAAFEVELKSTGKVYRVPPDRTILDVLIEAGEDPLHDCRRGDCGICQVGVIEGEVDHRDVVLNEAERAGNAVMQICVSRARSPRLVLDL